MLTSTLEGAICVIVFSLATKLAGAKGWIIISDGLSVLLVVAAAFFGGTQIAKLTSTPMTPPPPEPGEKQSPSSIGIEIIKAATPVITSAMLAYFGLAQKS
jgi:hypothetical protein